MQGVVISTVLGPVLCMQMKTELLGDAREVKAFVAEARLLKRLHHRRAPPPICCHFIKPDAGRSVHLGADNCLNPGTSSCRPSTGAITSSALP